MEFLKVYQITFKPEHVKLLEHGYCHYINGNCTVYFENDVMSNLISIGEHKNSEYFGVVSYKLREKIGDVMQQRWKTMVNIANHSLREFTPALFENELQKHKPDAMSFQRHLPHDPVMYANNFHPGFSELFKKILGQIGFKWEPTHIKDVFYCNYFVARSDLYERFVNEMLDPAMEVMDTMPELMENSRYPQQLPVDLQEKFGITWYPYHAFLCERMFSYWAHLNKLNCLHY